METVILLVFQYTPLTFSPILYIHIPFIYFKQSSVHSGSGGGGGGGGGGHRTEKYRYIFSFFI